MPGPYEFYYEGSLSFDWIDSEGNERRYEADPTGPYIVETACNARALLLEFKDKTRDIPYAARRPGYSLDEITEACVYEIVNPNPAERVDALLGRGLPPPSSIPPADEDIGPDRRPPTEGETSDSLNAPDIENPLTVSQDPLAANHPDARPLAQQALDQYPLPPEVVADVLSNMSIPPDEIDAEIEAILNNEPVPGLPHWDHGLDNRDPPQQEADPVAIFDGRYTQTVIDVQIPSRGFPLQLTRVYRSGAVYFGPWGYNWDHNYNVYLRELIDGSAAIWTGRISEQVYRPDAEGGFEPPVDVFMRLEHHPTTLELPDHYVLTDREGMQQIFERPEGWPHPDRIPLIRIEDRHGNAHQLSYDAEGRLERVLDHAERYIEFIYGNCGLLEKITDHIGRTWLYTHDPEIEHLVAVTKPGIPEYPDGLTTTYEYDRYRTHPALLHNLIKVINSAGEVVVENQYGDEPGTDDFGRVIRQEYAGYEATFHAKRLQYVPRVPGAINVPALRVEMIDPGVLYVYTFNYRGNLLDERFRLVEDGSYRLVARTYRYDEQGNLIEQREPNGLKYHYTYDHEKPDPRARGNLRRSWLEAPLNRPAVGREIASITYEPRYHRIKSITDEGGSTTTYKYDYEETTTDCGDVIRIEAPIATLPDGTTTQESHENFTYNEFGQLVERHSGEGHIFNYEYYDSGPEVGYLYRTVIPTNAEDITQEFGYDLYGNVSTVSQPEDSVTEYEYNAIGQMIRSLQPEVDGERGEIIYHYGRNSCLKAKDLPRGSYQDDVISDPYIRQDFDFNVLGHLRSMIHGVNTAHPRQWRFKRNAEGLPLEIVDPLGRKTCIEYDERHQPVKQTVLAGTDEERKTRFIYERNGPLSRVIDPMGREVEYRYDSWDRRFEVKLPGSEATRTRVVYHYRDPDQPERIQTNRDQPIRIETIGVAAPGELPAVIDQKSFEYDERGRVMRQIQGAISNEIWYDRDSCVVRKVDQRGNATSFTCDVLGRVLTITDPLSNSTTFTFDQRGNLERIEETELVPGRAEAEIYITSMQYDARNRLRGRTDPLGNTLTAEYDDRDLMTAAITPLNDRSEYQYNLDDKLILTRSFVDDPPKTVEHKWQLDLGGRLETYIDPEDIQTRYEYGLHEQWTRMILPDGSAYERSFDKTEQVIRKIEPSGTEITYVYGATNGLLEETHYVAGQGVTGLPELQSSYDGLGRPVHLAQGDVTLDIEHDQFGRLTRETLNNRSAYWTYDDVNGFADLAFPDGRVDRHYFDALGRRITILLQRLANTPLTGPTLAAGSSLAQYEYAGPQRLLRRVLGNRCETHYTYDQGRRLSGINHRDSGDNQLALLQYVYDKMGRRRVIRVEPVSGQSAIHDYDQLSRLRQTKEGITASTPPQNATQEESDAYTLNLEGIEALRTYEYSLDRTDARHQKILTDETGVTTETYSLNDLHQITELIRTAASTTTTHDFTYDRDGRRTGDDRYTYAYDVLGRLIEVHDVSNGNLVVRQSYDPLGRVILRNWSSAQSEHLRYLGDRLLQHETDAGIPIRQHCFGINIDELVVQSHGEEQWGHQDARLSLIALSENTGNLVARYSYTPFGLPTIMDVDGVTPLASSNYAIPPIFGGHRAIALNGIYDSRARVYDAVTADFLQRDPVGYSSSANLYTYIGHNPINLTDPTGNDPDESYPDAGSSWELLNNPVLENPLWQTISHNSLSGAVAIFEEISPERLNFLAFRRGTWWMSSTKYSVIRELGSIARKVGWRMENVLLEPASRYPSVFARSNASSMSRASAALAPIGIYSNLASMHEIIQRPRGSRLDRVQGLVDFEVSGLALFSSSVATMSLVGTGLQAVGAMGTGALAAGATGTGASILAGASFLGPAAAITGAGAAGYALGTLMDASVGAVTGQSLSDRTADRVFGAADRLISPFLSEDESQPRYKQENKIAWYLIDTFGL